MLNNIVKKFLAAVFTSVAVLLAFPLAASAGENIEVHFIDVGQADAALIKCDGHNMLIDGGNSDDSQLIYTYLKNQGVSSLDYIVNTHGDADHVGGLPGAISLVGKNIGTVLAPYKNIDKERFQTFARKVSEVGKEITVPKAGAKYSLGSSEFQILSAGGNGDNNSIVLRLKYGSTSFLFTGDASEEQEKQIINSGYDVESDVLKIGHHGSSSSTSYQWLRAVYPKAAVICVGKGNTYGHPTDTVLSRLRDQGAKVFRTDNNGDIVFYSDGNKVSYNTEKPVDQETNLIPGGTTANKKDSASTENIQQTGTSAGSGAQTYVLNTNTKKFHYPGCKSVLQMKDKNKKIVEDTRDNIISQGYDPCKNCNP